MEKLIEEFSIGLFFWQTVIFLLLIWLLKKYAWTPILNTINEREEGIKNALESAEKAREEIKTLKASNCLLYTSPSPRDTRRSRMPSSA